MGASPCNRRPQRVMKMRISRNTLGQVMAAAIASILTFDISLAVDQSSPHASLPPTQSRCEDNVVGVAAVVPKLDSRLFKTTKTSYHWEIVEDDDGNLENTLGGQIAAEDLLRIEHTADCTSSHQGKHLMEFCDAVATTDGIKLTISGGMPAYASDISLTINSKLEYKCSFSAVYPGPTDTLHWKVTKKALKLKSANLKSGTRIRGWISVEFEEMVDTSKESHTYKIEGYFKPVIQTMPGGAPSKEGEPAGADQPATQPADKVPAEAQPPTQPSKDSPR
jgi:hypothetical protein